MTERDSQMAQYQSITISQTLINLSRFRSNRYGSLAHVPVEFSHADAGGNNLYLTTNHKYKEDFLDSKENSY